jgi:hypothetical protein
MKLTLILFKLQLDLFYKSFTQIVLFEHCYCHIYYKTISQLFIMNSNYWEFLLFNNFSHLVFVNMNVMMMLGF